MVGAFLLSVASPEKLSWIGFVVLIIAMVGEVGVCLIPSQWENFHRHMTFILLVLAAAGYSTERVGDDAIIAALERRASAAEAKIAPRKLVVTQQADVTLKIIAFKGQHFFGQVGTPISDARILWGSIVKALQDGEWQLISAGGTGNPPAADVLNPPEGVAIFVTKGDAATVPAANALVLALRDAGLEANDGYSDKPDMSAGKIKIAIGVRAPEPQVFPLLQ
jgi:hypothetical protein